MRVAMAFMLLAVTAAAQSTQRYAVRPAAGLIVGQVVDGGSGRPIAGATVAITGSADGRQTGPSPRVLSTSDGRFFFRDLPRGTFTITATRLGYADGASGRRRPGGPAQPITLADGERVGDVTVRMWKRAAITGTVVDEMGEPVIGVQVRAFKREFAGGRQRYVPDVSTQPSAITDDRGVYRFGSLMPGDYIVATVGRPVAVSVSMAQELQTRPYSNSADIGPVALPGTSSSIQIGNIAYGLARGVPIPAPARGGRMFVYPQTFYPSVPSFPQAAIVSVGAGEERSAIDLQIYPLPTLRVAGIVLGPDGPATALALRMLPAAAQEVGLALDVPTAVSDRNGNFEFPAVPAGHYVIRASIRPPRPDPRMPLQPMLSLEMSIAVGKSDIEGVVLSLQPGVRVSGRLEFEGNAPRPLASRLQQVPVLLEAARVPANGETELPGRVEADGQFAVPGAPPGQYLLRVGGSPEGWMFKSATWRGRNVSDEPFDLESDANDVVITFTDRWTGMHGVVQGPRGPDRDATVLIFPMDQEGWTNYGLSSRRVRSVRTSRSGDYSVHSIPTGDYYVVAVPDERAADWRDPAFLGSLTSVAARVTIRDGDQKLVGLRTREVR
jgi:protocatechuate 3,4-dioxygenase beta subunit